MVRRAVALKAEAVTHRTQSMATISVMSAGGSPTEVSTITMVTRPAWGIPAAPMLAAVAVILGGVGRRERDRDRETERQKREREEFTFPRGTYIEFGVLIVVVSCLDIHFMRQTIGLSPPNSSL